MSQLNCSMGDLADAFRAVISEAVQPVSDEVSAIRGEMQAIETRLNQRIDTTNENVQAQLSAHREEANETIREALSDRQLARVS